MAEATASGLPPPFCKGSWRQLTIVMGVSAAAVLALALRSYATGETEAPPQLAGGRLDPRSWGAAAAKVSAVVSPDAPAAATDAVFPASRPVAATTRVSFAEAARLVQPATLAVRAGFGLDARGQLVERSGSAVIVDAAGYAITCTHVVAGAKTVTVRRFQRERWWPTRVVASEGDLTLLQVMDGEPMTAATLGDSSRLAIGDWVLAIGHPFQLGMTVTAGIVSRRDASLVMPGGAPETGLIQTDAAINEGSSGGPLVNAAGEVVGVNSAIYAPTGTFSGASFAIPADRVRKFLSSVLGAAPAASQAAPSTWGLGLVALTPELAAKVGFAGSQGVVVSNVAPSSSAARAQLSEGDVITSIAGEPVGDLTSAMAIRDRLAASPTSTVTIEFVRSGVSRTATLIARQG